MLKSSDSAASKKGKAEASEEEISKKLIRAISHPLRLRALNVLNERVASPNELALELGTKVNLIAYHIRVLAKNDCIELVDEQPRRGATEHFYRAIRRAELEDQEWLRIPRTLREEIDIELITAMAEDLNGSLASGRFEARGDRHWSHTPGAVDEEGWGQVRDLLRETQERYMEILGTSQNRMADSGEDSIRLAVTLQSFELGEP